MNQDLHTIYHSLLENDSFIRWVQSDFVIDDNVWSDYIDANPDALTEINTAIRTVQGFQLHDHSVVNEEQLWNRISKGAGLREVPGTRRGVVFMMQKNWMWLAAACFIFIFVAIWAVPQNTTLQTSNGEEITSELPDGSSVHLGAGSIIQYNSGDWKNTRKLSLEGLAFFDVKKGSSFEVNTPMGKVVVLGTSFSVQSRKEVFEVICRTGKVSVTNNAGKNELLLPGEKLVSRSVTGNLSKSKVDVARNDIPWLEGVFTFENATLQDVADEIEYQYDVKIQLGEDAKNRRYTGFFRKGNLETSLQSVFWPLNLNYSRKGNLILVSAK